MTYAYVGLDIGQRQDHSAIAVVERLEVLTGEFDRVHYVPVRRIEFWARHLERIRLGTPYPKVIDRVRALVTQLAANHHVVLIVDAGGPGMPVVDLFKRAQLKCTIAPVIVTAGDRESYGTGVYTVPRKHLIQGVKIVIQTDQLRLQHGTPEANILEKELTNLTLEGGGGHHDDLAFALSLALWRARKTPSRGKELDRVLPHY